MNKKILLFLLFIITNNKSSYTNCPLCNNGETIINNHMKTYGNITTKNNILFESPNFYVAIDNYPVCHGHTLIVPKKHFLSFSTIEIELKTELDAIINALQNIWNTTEFCIFEHGSNLVNKNQIACGNSVYHAHLHFIPNCYLSLNNLINLLQNGPTQNIIKLKKDTNISFYNFIKNKNESFLDYIKRLPTTKPYLFCYYSNIESAALCLPDEIIENTVPSQIFRRLFAQHSQKEETQPFWNWKITDEINRSKKFREDIIIQIIKLFENINATEIFNSYFFTKKEGTMNNNCIFCNKNNESILEESPLAYSKKDKYPVTQEHTLIITKRHVDNFFDLTNDEILEINELLKKRKEEILQKDKTVTGFNIGVNIGESAGQSVFHVHIHLIPRRLGDIENPKGGVRGVIPDKRNY